MFKIFCSSTDFCLILTDSYVSSCFFLCYVFQMVFRGEGGGGVSQYLNAPPQAGRKTFMEMKPKSGGGQQYLKLRVFMGKKWCSGNAAWDLLFWPDVPVDLHAYVSRHSASSKTEILRRGGNGLQVKIVGK